MARSRDRQGPAWTDTPPLTVQHAARCGSSLTDRARKPQVPRSGVSRRLAETPGLTAGVGPNSELHSPGCWVPGELPAGQTGPRAVEFADYRTLFLHEGGSNALMSWISPAHSVPDHCQASPRPVPPGGGARKRADEPGLGGSPAPSEGNCSPQLSLPGSHGLSHGTLPHPGRGRLDQAWTPDLQTIICQPVLQ